MITNIAIAKIQPHPDNPRKDLGDLAELAESIKANGILQNLTVVPWFSQITGVGADDPKQQEEMGYIVVIGHRRLAAAKLAGLKEVPCVIAEMGLKEQVATMLVENMQRSDLTVYEQAQGFQMMLNFGDTVSDIAERTGFSQTTVRHRVKLLDLDQDKFKESVERGATLMDYAELEKVKNPELRNSVLEHIGTSNFNWKLQRAIEEEKAEKNMVVLLERLSEIATEVKETPKDYRYYKTYYPSRESEFEMPENAGEVKYLYIVSDYGYVTLYSEYVETAADAAEKEQIQRQKTQRNALDEISERAYKLRRKFVLNISNAKAKKHIGTIIENAVYAILENHSFLAYESLVEMLNIKIKGNDEWVFEDIIDDLRQQPERYMLIATYCILDSSGERYYGGWNCAYKENEELDRVYDLLEALGYEISDEERRLKDGSHKLFLNEA